MPFALKVKSDVTAKGQSVFDESTLFSGSHGGVAILAKKSLHLHLIPLELPATYDFASFLIWLQTSGSALIFLLVYLPPLTSSYVISPQELSNCIEHAKQSSSSLVPSGYTCSFCLLGDLNLPDTDWNSMYSTSSFENQYLDIFVSHGRSASINIPTHKAGNTLDNILLENVNQFDDFMVIKDLFLSDQYPILFDCLISSSSSKSNPLASSYSFNSAKEISSFIDSWSYFTFTDFPSSATVDSFYSYLNLFAPQTFSRKTKKRLNNPFYYSSHSMHYLNIKETAQRKYIRNPSARNLLMLERAKEDFLMSVELDKICFFSGSFTQNTSDVFSLLNSLKVQNLPSSMKYNSTFLTNDLDIAKSFDEYFSSSFNSQTYPSSAPLCPCDVFLEDIFDTMTIESIYR